MLYSRGYAVNKVPPYASEMEQRRLAVVVVADRAERLEQVGTALDLVDGDEFLTPAKRPFGCRGKHLAGGHGLQVMDGAWTAPRRYDLHGECRLADLSRTHERQHGGLGQAAVDGSERARAGSVLLYIVLLTRDIQQ